MNATRKQIFNEVLKPESCPPETWRRKQIKVYQKMNEEDVGNYRPIWILAALYKLFPTILYNTLQPRLDQIQSEDQGGFWRSYQALDHLAMFRTIEQKCKEWGVIKWIATIDFMMASDSTNHNSFWDAVKTCGIEHEYISLLKRLYNKQETAARLTKRVTCSTSKVRPSKVTCYPACSSTLYCRWP